MKRELKRNRELILYSLGVIAVGLAITFFIFAEKEKKQRIETEEKLFSTIQAKRTVEQNLEDEQRKNKELAERLTEEKRRKRAILAALNKKEKELNQERKRRLELQRVSKENEDRLKMVLRSRNELKEKLDELTVEPKTIELKKIVVRPITSLEGKILRVNREFEFVIIDLGKQDNLKVGTILAVYRAKEIIGKVRVEKLAEKVSGATILHQMSWYDISEGDTVREL